MKTHRNRRKILLRTSLQYPRRQLYPKVLLFNASETVKINLCNHPLLDSLMIKYQTMYPFVLMMRRWRIWVKRTKAALTSVRPEDREIRICRSTSTSPTAVASPPQTTSVSTNCSTERKFRRNLWRCANQATAKKVWRRRWFSPVTVTNWFRAVKICKYSSHTLWPSSKNKTTVKRNLFATKYLANGNAQTAQAT